MSSAGASHERSLTTRSVTHHSSLITHHSSLITHHSSLITHHTSLITHHSSLCDFHLRVLWHGEYVTVVAQVVGEADGVRELRGPAALDEFAGELVLPAAAPHEH